MISDMTTLLVFFMRRFHEATLVQEFFGVLAFFPGLLFLDEELVVGAFFAESSSTVCAFQFGRRLYAAGLFSVVVQPGLRSLRPRTASLLFFIFPFWRLDGSRLSPTPFSH